MKLHTWFLVLCVSLVVLETVAVNSHLKTKRPLKHISLDIVEKYFDEWIENAKMKLKKIPAEKRKAIYELEKKCKNEMNASVVDIKKERNRERDKLLNMLSEKDEKKANKFFEDIYKMDDESLRKYMVDVNVQRNHRREMANVKAFKRAVCERKRTKKFEDEVKSSFDDNDDSSLNKTEVKKYNRFKGHLGVWCEQEDLLFIELLRFYGTCHRDTYGALRMRFFGSRSPFKIDQHVRTATHKKKSFCKEIYDLHKGKRANKDEIWNELRRLIRREQYVRLDTGAELRTKLEEANVLHVPGDMNGVSSGDYEFHSGGLGVFAGNTKTSKHPKHPGLKERLKLISSPQYIFENMFSEGGLSPKESPDFALLETARPIEYDGIQYKSGTCGPKAADVFLGVEGDISTGFKFTCDTSENLCKCLVDVGDNSKTVEFVSESPAETLKLYGDGESVMYEFGSARKRRRLLARGAGSS